MKPLYLILLFIFTAYVLKAQTNYNNLAAKPIGHNIAQSTLWRYTLKKQKKENPEIIEIDTVFNSDGTIAEIDTSRIQYFSTGDFDYPDTLIEEKNVYNSKGLLIFKEEPFHVHVDAPCRLTETTTYDHKNRILTQDVYECDSIFHIQVINNYNDKLKQYRSGLIEYDSEDRYMVWNYDKHGRRISSNYYSTGDSIPNYWKKTEYYKLSRKIKQTNYDNNKIQDVQYIWYNKHHQITKQVTVDDILIDSLSPPDTIISELELFTYNKANKLTYHLRCKKGYDGYTEKYTYTYDADNILISEHETNTTYKRDKTTNYNYRYDGLLDYYDEFYDSTTHYRYQYQYLFYNHQPNTDTSIEYVSEDSLSQLFIYKTNKYVTGTHCFHTPNHNEVDCCVDDTENSFLLLKQPDGSYSGNIKSCFDNTQHQINLIFKGKHLQMQLADSTYAFFEQSLHSINFNKVKKKRVK